MDGIMLTKDIIPTYLHNIEVYNMLESNEEFKIPICFMKSF